MDENDLQQNESGDNSNLSKSIDENSFIGKMKFGVSKILPNSLTKWLSPKVDGNNGRRRRHEEIDSDESYTMATTSSAPHPIIGSRINNRNYYDAAQSMVPPTKKQRTTSALASENTFNLYSQAPKVLGNSIVSSTLIEDTSLPQRVGSQFNRCLPIENGQPALLRDERDLDEGSSSQSRDKSTNPFTVNNESSVVNYSAHLQRAKSLFNNRSYVNQKLKNYRMRNPRSSLYRSTSSLCDNNSVSSNASSAMSSPFYNGQTTYGGASATSRRLNSTFQVDPQSQMHHRPKIPTNLVTSKSTSSLNTINGSASMSTTAKRILDVMNRYNTPLTEVRRISNALPSIAETSMLNKRKSLLDLDSSLAGSEVDRTKRVLLKPNTPYNRPFGRNPIDSILTTELHVPSMPELLQLKKFATSTMQIREIANKTDNILNKPITTQASDLNATKTVNNRNGNGNGGRNGDLDASNNNKKIVNNNNEIMTAGSSGTTQHKNKIRSNISKRRMRNHDEDLPVPVDLPNVQLQMDKKTEINFSEPFKFQIANTTDSGISVPFKYKSSNTTSVESSSANAKQINGNDFGAAKKNESKTVPEFSSMPTTGISISSTGTNSDLGFNAQSPKSLINELQNKSSFKFSEPIVVAQQKNTNCDSDISPNFKFSQPLYVKDGKVQTESVRTVTNFKSDTKSVKPIDSGIFNTPKSFISTGNKSTGQFSSSLTFCSSKDVSPSDMAKIISSAPTQPSPCDIFKSITSKQKLGKWECSMCLVSNDADSSKCVCCQVDKPKGKESPATESKVDAPAIKPIVDDGFKSLVAKQKQGKWECKSCFSSNDTTSAKCMCCDEPQPGASNTSSDKNVSTPQKSFTFGAFSTPPSKLTDNPPVDNKFKSIAAEQKSSSWECSSCMGNNNLTSSKCICCGESKDPAEKSDAAKDSLLAKPTTSQFSFGSQGIASSVSSKFSFGSNPNNTDVATAPVSCSDAFAKTTSMGQFSFGNSFKANESLSNAATKTVTSEESNKKLDSSITSASPAKFSFGTAPSFASATSKVDEKAKPFAAQADGNDLFKKIVAEQNSKWECQSCMVKNDASAQKCMACESPKDGVTAPDTNAKKDTEPTPKPSFVFGSAVASSSTFTFGSKPENKEDKPAAAQSIFGSTAFGKSSNSFQFGSTSTTAAASTTSSTSSTFSIKSSGSAFTSPATKPTETFAFGSSDATKSDANSGFSFGFGSSSSASNVKSQTTSSESTKDETDTGMQPTLGSNTGNTVVESVLFKPAGNGPIAEVPSKPLFSFGSNIAEPIASATNASEPKTKGLKRSNEEATSDSSKFVSSTPFTFGKSEAPAALNPFGATTQVTSAATPIQQDSQKPFAFGSPQPAANTFSTVQPTFSAPTFAFGANSTPAIPAAATTFGASSFSSASTFKTNSPFGTASSAPTFGAPTLTTPTNQTVQQPTMASPSTGLFQFGGNNEQVSSPFSGDVPKLGGFNFSATSAPSFNFSQQPTAQPNVPFQFGAPADAQQNLFAVQSQPNTSAIQQRRKIRSVRRLNRP